MARRARASPTDRQRLGALALGAGVLLVTVAAIAGLASGSATPVPSGSRSLAAAAPPTTEAPAVTVPSSSDLPSPSPTTSPPPVVRSIREGPYAGGLLIADRGNDRLLIVDATGRILWHFPVKGSLPAGQSFSADDAFVSPDGLTISANEADRLGVRPLRSGWLRRRLPQHA
jgi:hypothetical protein